VAKQLGITLTMLDRVYGRKWIDGRDFGREIAKLNARSQDGHKIGPDEIKNMNLKKFPVGGSGFEPL
jgi:hypothetical protein